MPEQRDFDDLLEKFHRHREVMVEELHKVVIGQDTVIDQMLAAIFTGGHCLLVGVPGLAKTLIVSTIARILDVRFKRIQFTPDLMPTDVTGHAMYDQKSEQFRIRRGPAFTQLLLADEINRAPAKTQAALLEVMQERQITIEGKAFTLNEPYMVLATQNPLDQEGTYPLPEAELDRFLFKVLIDYPDHADETRLVNMVLDGTIRASLDVESLTPVTDAAGLKAMKTLSDSVLIDDEVLDYALRIVRATRDFSGLSHGASPRASIALARASRVQALFEGRDFVTPDDVQQVARPVLRHRIQLSADAEIEGQTPETALGRLLEQVEAPKQ